MVCETIPSFVWNPFHNLYQLGEKRSQLPAAATRFFNERHEFRFLR